MEFVIVVGERWLVGLAIAVFVLALFFAFDVFLLFKNRDFGIVRFYSLRLEPGKVEGEIGRLEFVTSDISVPLKQLIPNRFLLWHIMWSAFRLPPDHLVLIIGKYHEHVMELIRFQLAPLNRAGIVKDGANRVVPGAFKIVAYSLLICFVFHRGVFKVWLVQRADLENVMQYLKSVTNRQAQKRKILFELVRVHKERPDAFLPFKLIAG